MSHSDINEISLKQNGFTLGFCNLLPTDGKVLRLPAFIALRRDKLLPSATLVIQEINSNKKSFSV